MKRYSIILATALVALSAFAYGYRQSGAASGGQQRRPRRDVTRAPVTTDITEAPKGKALVENLPEGAEGVVLEKGVVKAKSGYKFVKKGSKVMVMKTGASGGVSLGGSWSCNCTSGGEGCETFYDEGAILCRKVTGKDACSEKCLLSITIKGVKAQIIQY